MDTVAQSSGRTVAAISYQGSHAIPQQLYSTGSRPSPALRFFEDLVGTAEFKKFVHGPTNKQPLPNAPLPDGYAAHNGRHDAYTEFVEDRLKTKYAAFRQQNLGDITAFETGSDEAKAAAKARLEPKYRELLQTESNELQFRSTNFMETSDVPNSPGKRLIYNATDIEYLRNTQIYRDALPAEKQAVEAGGEALKNMIKAHNTSVMNTPLSADQNKAFKVLKDLAGNGGISHLDGTLHDTDMVRAIVREANQRGVDILSQNVNTIDFLNALETEFELDPRVVGLSQQIDDLSQQISNASDAQLDSLIEQRDALVEQRKAVFKSQLIGGMNADEVRGVVNKALTAGGELSERSLRYLGRLGVRALPVANVLFAVQDAMAYTSMTTHILREQFGSLPNAADWLLSRLNGTNVRYFRVAGDEVLCWNGDNWLVGTSPTTGTQCLYIPPHEEAQFLSGAGLTPEDASMIRSQIEYRRLHSGEQRIDTYREAPVAEQENGTRLSVEQHQTITADADGQETGRSSETRGNVRDKEGKIVAQLSFAQLGAILGTNLARLLQLEDPLASLAVGTLISTIGLNIGQALDSDEVSLSDAFDNIDDELIEAGVGAVSSYLFGELIDELGITGELGAVLSTTGGAAIGQIATNIYKIKTGVENVQVFDDVVGSLGNAAGAFIGQWLASQVIQFDTIEGQIGASLGGAIGAAAGAKLGAEIGTGIWPVVGTVIGAFLGYIFGGLIGSLFSSTPRSGAGLQWNDSTDGFEVAGSWARGGASHEGARSIAGGAAQVLNAIIEMSGSKLADADSVRLGSYGTHKKNIVYRTEVDGRSVVAFRSSDVNAVIKYGIAISAADLIPRMVGGNVFVKRALAATYRLAELEPASIPVAKASLFSSVGITLQLQSFSIDALFGNLHTALEYTEFLKNATAIKAMLSMEPTSVASSMWTITLGRAWELGLHKRADTDWIGGWNTFLDEAKGGTLDSDAWNPSLVQFGFDPTNNERIIGFYDADGNPAGALEDTIDNAAKDHILGTDGDDYIVIDGKELTSTAGLTVNGEVGTGAPYTIDVAAMVIGGAGNDTIISGDLGNDLIGGEGDDTLVGGKLDDWLFGDEGDDRLFAGASNYQFLDGDAAGTAAALNTVSNGDMLDGGAGRDVLYGSRGSDWLRGGDGNDLIYGGDGGDIIDGGAGNDSVAGVGAALFGGGGTDQYVFGYGSGEDAVFDSADNAASGSGQDSLYTRMQLLSNGTLRRNWAGNGDYEIDGSVKGGEDAIAFGPGIGMQDLVLQRQGQDLHIRLTYTDPESGTTGYTGDELVISNWFESTNRVEWLRFADGEEVRIGDITSFIIGTDASDVIIGTNAADFMYGGAGDDQMFGLAGNDFGFGGSGRDVVAGDADNDWVAGGRDDDKVMGGAGHDTVFGDGGNDEVYGGASSDIVVGGQGDDLVVGGAGDDIFKYQRGDGGDTLLDEYVDNWDLVWQGGVYVNGYSLDSATGTVWKNGEMLFDGTQWIGQYEYDEPTQTYRRHLGTIGGALATNAGTDYLEFGVGIDIQDLLLRRDGSDLQIAITSGESDGRSFDSIDDTITIGDWYSGARIENFIFAATGRHDFSSWSLSGTGTENSDTIEGTSGSDWITGNGGDDALYGYDSADILAGNNGSDVLRGGAGDDVLYGGAGDDLLDGSAGADVLIGGAGTDIVSYESATGGVQAFLGINGAGTSDGDTLVGIEGIEGTRFTDLLIGDAGQNILRGLQGDDTLAGGAGDDVYEVGASSGFDTIYEAALAVDELVDAQGNFNAMAFTLQWNFLGSVWEWETEFYNYELIVTHNQTGENVFYAADYLYAAPQSTPPPVAQWVGRIALFGENFTFRTGNGLQVVSIVETNEGAGGEDTLEYGPDISLSDLTVTSSPMGTQIMHGSQEGVYLINQGDPDYAVETLQLSDGLTVNLTHLVVTGQVASSEDDFVAGDGDANTLEGLAGDDVISGAGGDDTLRGGEGDDILEGGSGADVLDGGNDSVSSGLPPSSTDQTRPYGDTIRYVRSDAGVTIDLAAGTASGGHASGDAIVGIGGTSTIENVVGSNSFGDSLRGDARANRLVGLGGNDVIEGLGGNDVLVGGLGTDSLYGGDGDDNIAGEEGADVLDGGSGKDLLAGGAGADTLQGGSGADVLSGGEDADTLYGGAEDDQLGGEAGSDLLSGDEGNDKLAGGEGDDTLYGGANDDILAGESGSDTLYGGGGNDTYYFGENDGQDVIVDAAGANRLAFGEVTSDRLWMRRSGNDLHISIIGGTTRVTVQGYYSGASLVREIALANESLFLTHAEPLIEAMTASVGGTYALPSDAVAYWPMQEAGGPILREFIGGHAGEYRNGASTSSASAIAGTRSAQFDGANDYVAIAHRPEFELWDGTLQLWFRANSLSGVQGLVSKNANGYADGGHFGLFLENGQLHLQFQGVDNSVEVFAGAGLIGASAWHHVAVTWGNGYVSLYLDGTQIASRESLWTPLDSREPIVIGASNSASTSETTDAVQNFFGGNIDEVAIFNRPLEELEIYQLSHPNGASPSTVPQSLPSSIAESLSSYWHTGGKAAPRVVDQHIDNLMGVVMAGNVGAVDHDDNIVSYTLESEPSIGSVALNASTGAWTYTPPNNPSGEDWFRIRVTDADGNTALQTIRMTLPPDPADPTVVTLVQVVTPQAPLTKPTFDTGSWGVHIQSTLTDHDTSEILDLQVHGVPDGVFFTTGTNMGGGVWSFGQGPWPTTIHGPSTWSQDLELSIVAISRELSTGHTYTSEPVALTIEINARPTDITSAAALAFNENIAADTSLTTFSATDADASDTATYTLVNDAGGRFVLGSDGSLRSGATMLNYESSTSHTITVRVTDSGGLTFDKNLTVNVVNVNETPTVTNQNLATNEDTVLAGNVGAGDPDGNISSYAVASGPTRGAVSLNAGTGAWTYTPNADTYGTDSFQVRVTDAGNLSVVQTITVNVASVNDAPSSIALSGAPASIAENDRPISGTVANAVVLGTLSATDVDAPDAGDFATHVFSVTDPRFEIVSGNVLRLRAGAVIDFEATPTVSVDVTVRDRNGAANGLTYTRQFTFTVSNQDDYFYGTSGADTISGTAGRNLMYGQGGNDTLTGANANDLIEGGDGADTLSGLGGDDSLLGGLGNDVLDGGANNDTLSGGAGDDTLRGQDGNDTLTAEAGLDLLQGGNNDDQLDGGADNDRLEGGAGADRLVGGTGDDVLIGGSGADRFLGGDGVDTVSYETATAAITVNVTTATGSTGDATGDIFEDAIERLVGSGYGDTITGSAASETIEGGAGNDTIYGGAGNDTLIGGDGADYLDAQSGNDTLNGGLGNDILIGGDDSDTYLMDVNSGADEIRNFDPNGADIDVVGYADIVNSQLWFERVNDDLVISVVGTSVRTTIANWYLVTTANDRSNYKIDFFLASDHVSQTINAEALVTLMSGYTKPTTQAQYDALHANTTFENQWLSGWNINAAPIVPTISSQSVNEDGTLTLAINITDDFTPVNGITVTVQAVRTDDNNVEDLRFVNAPTIGTPNASGDRTLTVTTKPNASGQVAIKVRAVDAGGIASERVFLLTVNAVADAPVLSVVQAATPTAPLTKPTLDSGWWSLNIQAALTDQDGSETLEVRIANVPAGITFNAGTNLGSGVWSFTPAQLTGLRVQGPATWSQDLALSVTAISRETATGLTATSAAAPLNIVINARPTDIATATTLSFNENRPANTVLATFTGSDADAGDTATFSLVNDAGGRFSIDSGGVLRTTGTAMNYESATSHTITVRVTDSGGLTYDENFTVNVLNVNEAPTDIATATSLSFNENTAANTVLATFTRTDPDAGDTVTFSLTNNAGGRFSIDSAGVLRTTSTTLNYESATSHSITVRATDAGGLTYDEVFTVNVLNVNEAPTDIALSSTQVYENDAAGTTVGTLSRIDVDAGDTATYTLVNNPGSRFQIVGNSLRTNAVLNYESATSHPITVRVTDAGGATYDKAFTISVLNRNEAPTDIWPNTTLAVNENTGAGVNITQLLRADPDAGDTVTFTRLPSNDLPTWDGGEHFDITADGWLRTTNHMLNYEARTSYQVRIQATDSVGNYYTEVLTVAVNNVAEAPTSIWADRTLSFAETTGTWTGIAWFGASDPENNISSYSLTSDAGGRFWMRSDGLLCTGGTPLDAETATGHWITVRATDATGLSRDQNFWVDVNDVQEAPVFNTTSFSVYEGSHGGPGNYLYTTGGAYALITGTNRENGYALSYQMLSGYGDYTMFSIDTSGYLHIEGTLDYESRSSYSVLARAWDGGGVGYGNYSDQWITVSTNNVEEMPQASLNAAAGNGSAGWQYAGTINGYDPDGGGVTYQILSAYVGWEVWYIDEWYGVVGGTNWYYASGYSLDAAGNLYVHYDGYPTGTVPNEYSHSYHFDIRVHDVAGNWTDISVTTNRYGYSYVDPNWSYPVVLDLDSDGVELVPLSESSVNFRADEKTAPKRIGWIAADDAVLALDRDGDNAITHVGEISFVDDVPGARSDLEGLAGYDSDGDGSFDVDDARFAEFKVWQDVNQDGVSQSEELKSLAEHDIVAIDLHRTLTGKTTMGARDNVITATSNFTRGDGSTGVVGDVVLASEASKLSLRMDPAPQSQKEVDDVSLISDASKLSLRRDSPAPQSQKDATQSQPIATEGPVSVDRIDRSANDDSAKQSPSYTSTDSVDRPAIEIPEADSPSHEFSAAPDRTPEQDDEGEKRRPWRPSDLLSDMEMMDDEDLLGSQPLAAQSALHANLSVVARRRLQMIEALASFGEEGAADLQLQPHRKVDARTLELLTSVPEVRVM